MRFEEDPVEAEVVLRRAYAAHDREYPRAPGLHASDLIFCLRKAWLRFHTAGQLETYPSVRDLTMWLTGLGHHVVLEAAYPNVEVSGVIPLGCMQGGQIHTHLVVANMDAEMPSEGIEIKTTRKTSAAGWPGLSYYVEQLVTYLAFFRKKTGWLHVFFLCGDYKSNRDAVFKSFRVEPSEHEIVAWIQELTRRAHVATGPNKPVPERMDWECAYCPYASARGGPCDQDVLSKGRDGDKTGVRKTGWFVLDEPPEWVSQYGETERDSSTTVER